MYFNSLLYCVGNGFDYKNGMGFTTKDMNNDKSNGQCAQDRVGAWWYKACTTINLNGQYFVKTPDKVYRGISWAPWKTFSVSLKATTMMIRRASDLTSLSLRPTGNLKTLFRVHQRSS